MIETARRGILYEKSMHDFQSQQPVDLGSVVAISLKMSPYHCLKPFSVDIRSAETARIEQHLPNVLSETIPVPDPEVEDLVPPEEEPFEVQRRQNMVRTSDPLGHAHVACVLGLEQKLEGSPGGRAGKTPPISGQAAVRWYPQKIRVSISDQAQRNLARSKS